MQLHWLVLPTTGIEVDSGVTITTGLGVGTDVGFIVGLGVGVGIVVGVCEGSTNSSTSVSVLKLLSFRSISSFSANGAGDVMYCSTVLSVSPELPSPNKTEPTSSAPINLYLITIIIDLLSIEELRTSRR